MKTQMSKASHGLAKYSEEYKQQALELWRKSGRNAEKSPGRTAILAALAVAGLLCFYLDVKTLLGTPGTMDWVDTVVNGVFGFGAAFYIYRDRKSV